LVRIEKRESIPRIQSPGFREARPVFGYIGLCEIAAANNHAKLIGFPINAIEASVPECLNSSTRTKACGLSGIVQDFSGTPTKARIEIFQRAKPIVPRKVSNQGAYAD
jgi:hypothetical protein